MLLRGLHATSLATFQWDDDFVGAFDLPAVDESTDDMYQEVLEPLFLVAEPISEVLKTDIR